MWAPWPPGLVEPHGGIVPLADPRSIPLGGAGSQGQNPGGGTLERFGRMLEGFGAGYQGREAPYAIEQREQGRRQLQERGLGLQERGLNLQERQVDATIAGQAQQASARRAKGLADTMTSLRGAQEYLATLPEENREAFRKLIGPMLKAQFADVAPTPDDAALIRGLDDTQMEKVLSTPGLEIGLQSAFALLVPEQKRALVGVKDPTKREQLASQWATANAISLMPGIRAKIQAGAKGATDLQDPSILDTLPLTPTERAAVNLLKAGKPEETKGHYNALGVFSPTQMAEQQMKTPQVGAGMTKQTLELLDQTPTAKAMGVTAQTFAAQSPEVQAKIKEEAIGLRRQEKSATIAETAAAQAKATVTATVEAQEALPYASWKGRETGHRIRNRATGEEAPLEGIPMGTLKADKRYTMLDAKREDAFLNARNFLGNSLPRWEAVTAQLAQQPGANLGQAAGAYVKQVFGHPNLKTEVETLEAESLRVARAVNGGVASQLSDRDLATIKTLVPGILDSALIAQQKVAAIKHVFRNLEKVALGDLTMEMAYKPVREYMAKKPITGIKPAR